MDLEIIDLDNHRERARSFFHHKLNSPKYILAPMVRGSEKAFRKLCTHFGVQLCYTPMITAAKFVDGDEEETSIFDIDVDSNSNAPVIVQLAGNDAEILLEASKLIEANTNVIAIDLNFGCPKPRASKCLFGAFLLDYPDKILQIVSHLSKNLSIPVFCKIRILPDKIQTIELARQLEKVGCSLLCVHGRLRGQDRDTDVDYDVISEIVKVVKIPVIANGGVCSKFEADKLIRRYNFDGIMIANALLENHRLLVCDNSHNELLNNSDSYRYSYAISLAFEYIEWTIKYPPPSYLYVQVHLRWIFRKILKENKEHLRYWAILSRPWMKTAWQYLCYIFILAEYLNVDLVSENYHSKIPLCLSYLLPVLPTLKSLKYVEDRDAYLPPKKTALNLEINYSDNNSNMCNIFSKDESSLSLFFQDGSDEDEW